MFKCEKNRCKICDNVTVGDKFKSNAEGRSFFINHRFDCDSEGVIQLWATIRWKYYDIILVAL